MAAGPARLRPGQAGHRGGTAVAGPAAARRRGGRGPGGDRYARYVGNPQRRYRVCLAGDAEWNAWFGGAPRRNAVGCAIPVGLAGTEVVLKIGDLKGRGDQRYSATYDVHEWLVEGVAEYIGFAPKGATANPRHQLVRSARRQPDTLAVAPLTEKAGAKEVSVFYGLGHHAVSCLVDRFGERACFDFFRRVLRDGAGHRDASRAAFGRPWGDVDRACVSSVRRAAG